MHKEKLPLTITALLITNHAAANTSTAAITAETTPVGKLFYHRINYSALGGKQNPRALYGRADNSLLLVYVFANVFWDSSEDQGASPSPS